MALTLRNPRVYVTIWQVLRRRLTYISRAGLLRLVDGIYEAIGEAQAISSPRFYRALASFRDLSRWALIVDALQSEWPCLAFLAARADSSPSPRRAAGVKRDVNRVDAAQGGWNGMSNGRSGL